MSFLPSNQRRPALAINSLFANPSIPKAF